MRERRLRGATFGGYREMGRRGTNDENLQSSCLQEIKYEVSLRSVAND